MLNKLNTDAEFKSECIANRDKVISILEYILEKKKQAVFTDSAEDKQAVAIKKIQNLQEIIIEIDNESKALSPEFNV